MPVPVGEAHSMPPSSTQSQDAQHVHEHLEPDVPESSSNARRSRKRKAKEADEAGTSYILGEHAWSWKSLTDSSASNIPPFFTKDGSYFFSVIGSVVKIYSVSSGLVVSTLDAEALDDRNVSGPSADRTITSAILNPSNAFQIITGSKDGNIRIWDSLDATLSQTISVGMPIFHIAAHENQVGYLFVAGARSKKKTTKARVDTEEDYTTVLRISLKANTATYDASAQRSPDTVVVGKTRQTTGLALSPSGSWLVATGGHKAYVCETSNLKSGFTKFVSPQRLTCIAFHPSEDYFATGDAIGCIRLWYCLKPNLTKTVGVERTAQTTMLHWHAHAVSSIAFTANGAYLLSGGEEGVLVIWQIHSGQKEYVPRVGAPIAHVVLLPSSGSGEEEYLLALTDASFIFIRSGTLKISRSIAQIKLDSAIAYNRPSTSTAVPLAMHSVTSALILPSSHPSSLQTFLPSSSKLLSELEVSPSNKISRQGGKLLEPPRVEFAVTSDSGDWLATLDSRDASEIFHGEVLLKIWQWDQRSMSWTLNTRIDRPHGLKKITGLAFRPNHQEPKDALLVSTGEDGHARLWGVRSSSSKSGEAELYWVARSTIGYRGELPTHVSWSADGSLFAVSYGPYVALYSATSSALIQALSCTECPKIISAYFVGTTARYVVASGIKDLMLWDLLTQTMRWHWRSATSIDRIVLHPREENFAVFLSSGVEPSSSKVLLFNPSSPNPFASRTVPFRLRCAISHPSLGALSTNLSSFTLVGITQTWCVVVFGDNVHLLEEEGSSTRGIGETAPVARRTLFQDIFGKSSFADPPTRVPHSLPDVAQALPWKGKNVADVFDTPAYLMPPLTSLFDDLLDGFLTARGSETITTDKEDEESVGYVDTEGTPELPSTEARIERVVDKQEMDAFVELFKQYAIRPSANTQPPPNPNQTNNLHKVNGAHKTRSNVNGVHHTAPSTSISTTKVNGISQKAQAMPSDASPITAGKKRKKSLG